jgi:hypothetical protein
MPDLIIRNAAEFEAAGDDLSRSIIFPIENVSFAGKKITRTILLGWKLDDALESKLEAEGALMFPAILDEERPYSIYRGALYTSAELFGGYDGRDVGTACDTRIFGWFVGNGGETPSPVESMTQRLHDFLINVALTARVKALEAAHIPIIGFMGGHDAPRIETAADKVETFRNIARLARKFTRSGYHVLTGGGPGVMEAANLGAFLAPHNDDSVIDEALALLKSEPTFHSRERWINTAQEVIRRFGGSAADSAPYGWISDPSKRDNPGESLSIPTWLYGFEPPNVFGSHIGKYFSNSVREDGLVSVAKGGIIYAEGSGGTVQEIFADAAQNYYRTCGASAMVLLGSRQWNIQIPVWECLDALARKSAPQHNPHFPSMIACLDDVDEVFEFIAAHPHIRR